MVDEIRLASVGDAGHFNLRHGLGQIEGLSYVAAASDGYGEPQVLSWEAVPTFGDFRRMLDEVQPDVVTVGGWYAHNGEVALACLRRGIHVVTDKPAVNSWDELAQARTLCAADPTLHLLTEFGSRMHPAFVAAQRAVAAGEIGTPVLLTAQKSYRLGVRPDFFKQRAHFSGLVMWVLSHALDFTRWASGLEYERFFGWQGNLSRPDYGEMEDHVAVTARMDNGAAAVLTADYVRPDAAATHGDDRLRIAGSEGIVEVRDGSCMLMTHDKPQQVIGDGEPAGDGLARELVATLRGQGSGRFSTAETLRTHGAMLAARDAADQEAVVLVER